MLALQAARAKLSGNAAEVDAVLAAYKEHAAREQVYAEAGVRAAAMLGREDMALELARTLYFGRSQTSSGGRTLLRIGLPDPAERTTAVLFVPPVHQLWQKPDMFRVAKSIGLTDYWRSSTAPDACRNPELRVICQQMLSR